MDFDNDFGHETVYRGPPTPALETAWEKLWYYNGVNIPKNRLSALNRTEDLGDGRSLKKSEDNDGDFSALIEVFHQLHCLVSSKLPFSVAGPHAEDRISFASTAGGTTTSVIQNVSGLLLIF